MPTPQSLVWSHRSTRTMLCSSVPKTRTERPSDRTKQTDTASVGEGLRRPPPFGPPTSSPLWGWERQCLLMSDLALEVPQPLLVYETLPRISFSGTDEPEWMFIFSETLLRYYVGSCCYWNLGYNSSWCYKRLCLVQSYFFIHRKRIKRTPLGVKVYNIFLYCDLTCHEQTLTPPTTMYSRALAKGNLGCAECHRNKPRFRPQGDWNSKWKVGFGIWCGVRDMLYVTNSHLNLTKTGNPLGNGLHHAWAQAGLLELYFWLKKKCRD